MSPDRRSVCLGLGAAAASTAGRAFAASDSAPPVQTFESFDGRTIAYRVMGEGRPTLLIHGVLSDGGWAWIDPGHAKKLAALGRRLIIPDLRAHGRSAAPHEAAAYPAEVLAKDQEALLAHLGTGEFDLVGYSLGSRTALSMMARGAKPGRAVLGGAGDGMVGARALQNRFVGMIDLQGRTGDPGDLATWGWIRQGGFDPAALRALMSSPMAIAPDALKRVATPCLIVVGEADASVGSPDALAALLPEARVRRVPGDHQAVIMQGDLSDAAATFLRG